MTEGAIAFAELFDADFLAAVERLRILARRVPRGGRPAEQRSAALGSGIEFRDFRPYVAGDDLRAVDWNIYRRLGRVFLRLFEEVEDLPLYLLPDLSASMFLEDPPRARAALRTTLALAAIGLSQQDAVGLLPFSDELRMVMRPRSGKGRLMAFAERLAALPRAGHTDLGRSLRRLNGMALRRGLVVILSDFFDPRGIDAVLEELRRVRHRLLLVQLVRKTDREATLSGDLRLVDCETGDHADVSITAEVLTRYRAAYDRFADTLTAFAHQRQCGLLRLDCDRDVVPQLAGLFESGTYVT